MSSPTMKATTPTALPALRPERRSLLRPGTTALLVMAIASGMALVPGGRGQYPFTPPPTAVTGPTLGGSLRNALVATQTQASLVRKGAYDWGRRAVWATYT